MDNIPFCFLWCRLCCHWHNSLKRSDWSKGFLFLGFQNILLCTYFSKQYTYIYICIFWQHFFINTNFIEHNRHFLSTFFLLGPFILPYCFYRIQQELIYVFSIYIPSTSCPTLGHHQGRIYYKSDVTFVFAYYYYVRASLPLDYVAFAFKWVSINSVSS